MSKGMILVRGAVAAMLAASVAMSGCAGAGQIDSTTPEQREARAYMSQVNETMMKLDDELDSFIAAVSRGDVVNMRTQADNAYKSLDQLKEIEAPESHADIHKNYVEGADKLREALDDYIDLYTKAAAKGTNFDWSSYDDEIASIQKLYDEGVSALEAGDKAAAESEKAEAQ